MVKAWVMLTRIAAIAYRRFDYFRFGDKIDHSEQNIRI